MYSVAIPLIPCVLDMFRVAVIRLRDWLFATTARHPYAITCFCVQQQIKHAELSNRNSCAVPAFDCQHDVSNLTHWQGVALL